MSARDYVFPSRLDLGANISNIQVVKKSFVRKFWKVSGKEIVREVAQRRLEEVSFPQAQSLFV
jgi:hypothetical protein